MSKYFAPLALASLLTLTACESLSARISTKATPSTTNATKAEKLAPQSLANVSNAIQEGDVTSVQMVQAYLDRIETIDRAGPTLQAVLALNPDALAQAAALDAELVAGKSRGPLHGIPVLLKDNIETKDTLATTAGSLALKDNITGRDAPLVANLRSAGAVILGKANMSEWAYFRSESAISGWSAIGGQVRNPHALDRSPCGSSSGSGAAASASLAAGTIGTETFGSIICPSSMQGVVGFKPTIGLVSPKYIVPISSTQDTAGPITRTVTGAALMLSAMADPAHAAYRADYSAGFSRDALQGKRIGVMHFAQNGGPEISALFATALSQLEAAGAFLVDINKHESDPDFDDQSYYVLLAEFPGAMNQYLASTDPALVSTRSLSDLIAFNEANKQTELALFDQGVFEKALATKDDKKRDYTKALAAIRKATRDNGIDKMLKEYDVELLVTASTNPAFLIDPVHRDKYPGGVGIQSLAAVAGYPHITVPMGKVRGLPVGFSIMASANQDEAVLQAGYAYEQQSQNFTAPNFAKTVEDLDWIKKAMAGE